MPPANSSLQVTGLSVSGKAGNLILRDLSFTLPVGITGLIGLNGAGKTTLMEFLAGFRRAQSGRVSNLPSYRSVGYLPQNYDMPSRATVTEIVAQSLWIRGYSGRDGSERTKETLRLWDLTEISTTRIAALSGGTRQRVAFAAATAHKPSLLLLDEPTVGLDVARVAEVRKMIASQKHCAVLFSSHIPADMDALADRVVVLSNGSKVYEGDLATLRKDTQTADLTAATMTLLNAQQPGATQQ